MSEDILEVVLGFDRNKLIKLLQRFSGRGFWTIMEITCLVVLPFRFACPIQAIKVRKLSLLSILCNVFP